MDGLGEGDVKRLHELKSGDEFPVVASFVFEAVVLLALGVAYWYGIGNMSLIGLASGAAVDGVLFAFTLRWLKIVDARNTARARIVYPARFWGDNGDGSTRNAPD